jgi:hypothetical protein
MPKVVIKTICLALVLWAGSASAEQSGDTPFNFNWQLTGTAQAMPTQVFGDETAVHMEFPLHVKPFQAFTWKGDQREPVMIEESPPYFIVRGYHRRLDIHTTLGQFSMENRQHGEDIDRLKQEISQIKEQLQVTAQASGLVEGAGTYWLRRGETLSTALNRWAGIHGWTVYWGTRQDYRIHADTPFYGSLPAAARQVLETYKASGALVNVRYTIAEANRVIALEE